MQQAFPVVGGTAAASSGRKSKIAQALATGLDHHRAGRLADALAAYEDVLAVDPSHLAGLVNKGVALRQIGKAEEAMACYWKTLAVAPDNIETWCNAANALLDLKRIGEARAAIETALRKNAHKGEAWLTLGNVLVEQKHLDAAESAFRHAIALAPDNVMARLRLAGLLEVRNPREALEAFHILQEMVPNEASAHSGYGQALISLGRLAEAEPHLRRTLEIDPNHLDGRLGLTRLLLLRGDLEAAWPAYEWRRKKSEGRYPKLPGAEWDGSDPAGKTILVYAEQGFGDTIQFARYLPMLAERGAKVVVVCQKSLVNMIGRVKGVSSAQAVWKPLPAYDFWIPMLTLPWRMGTTSETIPADVPYMPVPTLSQPLPAPVGTRLKVGIVWAGSSTHGHDQDRSAGLERMLPLTGTAGATFYSLQAGPRAADLRKFAHPALIADMSPALDDFAFTAGIIEQMDLVIAVDTSVAHLAGALGKPVWVLVPFSPDWRWLRDHEDTPWYPTMLLFRQKETGNWDEVIERVQTALTEQVAARPLPEAETREILINSAIPCPGNESGQPRFRMTAPRRLLPDPGIRFLVHRERAGTAYEYATRSFLDAHLQPGDLFIDVGAHWGIMSLQAVTRWPGEVSALALEPLPSNIPHLERWIADNGVQDQVEVIAAAASDGPGQGELKPESTMGHSLIKAKDGTIPVVAIDDLLAERPRLAERRVIVKIDVEGTETAVVDGMMGLLKSGRVAAVIWERGIEYENPKGQKRLKALRAKFDKLGFTAWRFEDEDGAGPLVPFVETGKRGNIIELAKGIDPQEAYGLPRPAPIEQPADPALDAALNARHYFQASVAAHKARKGAEALDLYAKAAALDGTMSELFNNLGVTLRNADKLAAAIACYRRGLALSPEDPGLQSNLANVLREVGHLDEAEELHGQAMKQKPGDSGLIYNAGVIQRDMGRPKEALALFEQALKLDPDNRDIKWDRALAMLQGGDYANGLPAYEARWGLDRARKKKFPMPLWDGSSLEGRNVFITDEQGFGDVLQFARFIPELKKRGAGKVVLECQPELMRLLALAPGVDAVLPRDQAVPACDVTIPLLSLPALFGVTLETLPASVPYLHAPEPELVLPDDGRLKMGLVWAGKTKPRDRSVPLQKLLPVLSAPRFSAFSLQVGPRAADLKNLGLNSFITDLGPSLSDFAETAAVLQQLDVLVTIDTAVAHLAGALGVPTFLLLRYTSDWRWFDKGETSPWYPSFKIFRQQVPDKWEAPVAELINALKEFKSGQR